MGSGPDSQTVRLEVPAKTDYVILARLALSAVCRLTPLPAEDVADLKLAITEAAAEFVAAGAGVGSGSGSPGPGPGDPATQAGDGHGDALRFAFELSDDRLVLEIAGGGGGAVSAEERELGRAIIAATVDECEYGDETTRLVKYLGLPTSV